MSVDGLWVRRVGSGDMSAPVSAKTLTSTDKCQSGVKLGLCCKNTPLSEMAIKYLLCLPNHLPKVLGEAISVAKCNALWAEFDPDMS